MDFREKRLGLNEAMFREVNERLEELAEHFDRDQEESLDLICECRKATCVQRIEMLRAEYKALRAEDTHFALYPGHTDPEIERVISSHAGYEIVRSMGQQRKSRATCRRAASRRETQQVLQRLKARPPGLRRFAFGRGPAYPFRSPGVAP